MTNHDHENHSDSNAGDDSHGQRQRPSYDDVNVPVVVLVGVISMVLTFVTIWFVEGVFYQWKNNLVLKRTYDVDNTIQTETINNQIKLLDGDEEAGFASLDSVVDGVLESYKNEHSADDHSGDAQSENDDHSASGATKEQDNHEGEGH